MKELSQQEKIDFCEAATVGQICGANDNATRNHLKYSGISD